jgi:hypothetical protein
MRIIHNDKKSFLQKLYVYITYKEGIHKGLIAVVVVDSGLNILLLQHENYSQ